MAWPTGPSSRASEPGPPREAIREEADLTGVVWFDVLIALIVGWLIWRVSLAVIGMLSTPPPEIDPDDIVVADQDYKCTVCGAELTMRAINLSEDKPPRHCREEMVPVWRPG